MDRGFLLLRDDEVAVGQGFELDEAVLARVDREVAEFFAAGVDDEDLARIAEIGNVAVAEFLGVADEAVAIAGRGEAEDLFAVGRYFDDALVGDDPGVAVGEALAAHEAVLDFVLPEDLAFEVALGDAAAGLLGD